jgi:hypothetical protein
MPKSISIDSEMLCRATSRRHKINHAIGRPMPASQQSSTQLWAPTNFHMLHPGKTGGSAVKAAFRQAPVNPERILHLHRHMTKLRDVPAGDRVFFFVRDPLTRFVSGFYSRQRQGQPRYSAPWNPAEKVAFQKFATPNALGGALASRNPAVRAAAVAAMKGIRHVKSSYWEWFHDPAYFESRLGDVLFIGFQETLDADFQILKSLLNLPRDIQLPQDDATSHRSPAGLDRTLNERAEAALRKWYAADYEFVERCREIRCRTRVRDCA